MDGKKRPIQAWGKPARGVMATVAVTSAAALLWSFPLILSPGKALIGHPGDSLSTLQRWEHWQPSGRYVERPLINLAGRLLSETVGPLLAYNLLVLASFPLSGAGGFLLCYRLTGHVAASILGGTAFALSPYHWAHSLGHIYEASIQWLPLWVLALLAFASRPSVSRGFWVAMASVLLIGSSFYYGFFAAIVLLPLAGVWSAYSLARGNLWRLTRMLAAAIAVFLFTLPITHSYLSWLVARRFTAPNHLEDLFRYSARIGEYLIPGAFSAIRRLWSPVSPLGSLHASNEVEQSLFLGWIPVALAVVGVAALARRGDAVAWRRGEACWVVAAGIVAAVCSGPPIVRVGSLEVRTPTIIIGNLVPFFRTYARMGVIVQLSVACAAAVGTAWCARGSKRNMWPALLLLLVAVEYTPVPPHRVFRLLPLRGAHAWVSTLPPGPGLIDFPFDSRATPRTTVREYVGAIHGRYSIEDAVGVDVRHVAELDDGLCRDLFPGGTGLILLHDRNPDPSLQVYKDRPARGHNLPGLWPMLPDGPGTALLAHFPESSVFAVHHDAVAVSLSQGEGLGPWLEGSQSSGRPLRAGPVLVLQSLAPVPLEVDLAVVIVPAGEWRALRFSVNNRTVATFAMQDTMRIALTSLEVLPDQNNVLIEPLDTQGSPLAMSAPLGRLLMAGITNERPVTIRTRH